MCPLLLRRKSIFDPLERNNHTKLRDSSGVEEVAQHIALARRYLSSIDIPATAEENAIVQIVRQDLPMLLAEVIRLRPELGRAFEIEGDRSDKRSVASANSR